MEGKPYDTGIQEIAYKVEKIMDQRMLRQKSVMFFVDIFDVGESETKGLGRWFEEILPGVGYETLEIKEVPRNRWRGEAAGRIGFAKINRKTLDDLRRAIRARGAFRAAGIILRADRPRRESGKQVRRKVKEDEEDMDGDDNGREYGKGQHPKDPDFRFFSPARGKGGRDRGLGEAEREARGRSGKGAFGTRGKEGLRR